ncbi:hypothetical protein [Streptomyces sp. CAI 127]|uniref:hypothetical protein n=1 Tax=Streptomyces sp. CAI 127 TaxID=1076397 RepID=UPI0015877F73|nr:hypothetical protein [Streptomyces sp. CAI 127]NUW04537.1 hypothetical protein [Streptomyces sp. CAI 127]
MQNIVAGRIAASTTEFIELALGTPLDLWLGVEGESEMERAAREDAARDILADNPDFPDRVSQVAAQAIEAHAPELFNVTVLPTRRSAGRRQYRGGVAA